ncbi:MAG: hypothetical protein HY289_08225 [Planctomycetes bacterium]|nr:hypothetical protein [Planctomycetota bacterium]
MPPKTQIELRVVTYQEDGVWLAHCLELDIVAEGKTSRQAFKDVVDLCNLQVNTAVEENDLLSIFRPAPAEFWKMFFTATKKKRVKPSANGVVKEIDERELELV